MWRFQTFAAVASAVEETRDVDFVRLDKIFLNWSPSCPDLFTKITL
jgi:hypothetical protein